MKLLIKVLNFGSPHSIYGLLKVLKILWKTVEVYLLALQRTNYIRLAVQNFSEKSPKFTFTSQLGLFLGKWAD